MRIGFCGAQGTGKSSLVEKMLELEQFKNHTQYTNTQRTLHGYLGEKFPHSSKTNDISQISITSSFVLQLLQHKDIICDRSLLDNFMYSELSEHVKNAEVIEDTFNKALELYDVIFYTPYEFDVVDDGFRDSDKTYVKQCDDTIKKYIKKYKNVVKVVTVSGSIEERMSIIMNTIKEIEE